MTKVAITGRFATTTDVIRVHRISPLRQAWLEEQLNEIENGTRGGSKKVAKTTPAGRGRTSQSAASRVRSSSKHAGAVAKRSTASAKKR